MRRGHRITSADFRTLRPTRRVQGDFFALALAPLTRGPAWAVVVSKKVSKKAVVRNRVKRRCRSVLATELKNLRQPLALIVTAKRTAAAATFLETKNDIETLLERAGLRGTMRGT